MKYRKRHIETQIQNGLDTFGALIIDGPKWCGKTTTAMRFAKSQLMLSDPTNDFENRARAQLDPKLAISGKTPRLLDEWQEVPKLWDAARFMVDEQGEKGMFILTGSATPQDCSLPMHSGTGRFGKVKMETMTLSELGISMQKLNFADFFASETFVSEVSSCDEPAQSHEQSSAQKLEKLYLGSLNAEKIAELIVRGGWPGAIGLSSAQAKRTAQEYISTICEADISKIDNVRRDPKKVRSLLFSLGRNESTYASINAIAKDVSATVSRQTLSEYLGLLSRLYICNDIAPWDPALRSPIKIRAACKHHLADCSLAAAALGADERALLNDFKTLGFLFESLVLHDLKVYAACCGAELFQYHDSSGLEVDAIIQKPNGDWFPIEIKLGAAQVEKAGLNLQKFTEKIVSAGNKTPLCKLIIYGFGTPQQLPEETCSNCIIAAFDTLYL